MDKLEKRRRAEFLPAEEEGAKRMCSNYYVARRVHTGHDTGRSTRGLPQQFQYPTYRIRTQYICHAGDIDTLTNRLNF
ncbi:hypothetical protein M3J09_009671 [Ascochyta lentis]